MLRNFVIGDDFLRFGRLVIFAWQVFTLPVLALPIFALFVFGGHAFLLFLLAGLAGSVP